MPGLPQVVEGLLQLEVGLPDAAMEGVEVPAGLLEHLERGRQLAEGRYRLVADALGYRVTRGPVGAAGGAEPGEQIVVAHDVPVPTDARWTHGPRRPSGARVGQVVRSPQSR